MTEVRKGEANNLWTRARRTRPGLRTLAATAAITVGLVAVGTTASAPSGGQVVHARKSLAKLTICYTAPVADMLPVYVTEKAGLFRKYGVDVNAVYLPQTEALDALSSGNAQMCVFFSPAPEVEQETGVPLKWLISWENRANIDLLGRPGIGTVAQLAGKEVGITGPGSTTAVLTESLLLAAHVLKKTHLIPLGNVGALISAFESGSIDAFMIGPPISSEMLKRVHGATILKDLVTGIPWMGAGVAALTSWTTTHKAETIDVMKGLIAGVKYFKLHPTKVEAMMETALSTSPGQANDAYLAARKTMNATPSLVPSVSVEQSVLLQLRKVDSNARTLKARNMIDNTYIKAALAALQKGK